MSTTEPPKLEEYLLVEDRMLSTRFPELVRLINRRAMRDEHETRVRTGHYASDTSKCLREQWYGRMGYPVTNPMDDTVRDMQDAGKVYEGWVKDMIRRAGLWAGEEVYVTTVDPPSSMRIDVLFDEDALYYFYQLHRVDLAMVRDLPPRTGELVPIPVEIKSVQPYAFEGGKDKPGYDTFPMWSHYCQLQLYLNARNAPFGFFIYVNRGTSERAAHLVLRDDTLIAKLQERQRVLDWFICNKTCPEREGTIDFGDRGGLKLSRRCGICPFVYYDYFDEILEKGTRSEISKMMKAISTIPPEFLTKNMLKQVGAPRTNAEGGQPDA